MIFNQYKLLAALISSIFKYSHTNGYIAISLSVPVHMYCPSYSNPSLGLLDHPKHQQLKAYRADRGASWSWFQDYGQCQLWLISAMWYRLLNICSITQAEQVSFYGEDTE